MVYDSVSMNGSGRKSGVLKSGVFERCAFPSDC